MPTGDALHYNCHTVAAINAGGSDWCLALNRNQESLLSDARGCFSNLNDVHFVASFREAGVAVSAVSMDAKDSIVRQRDQWDLGGLSFGHAMTE